MKSFMWTSFALVFSFAELLAFHAATSLSLLFLDVLRCWRVFSYITSSPLVLAIRSVKALASFLSEIWSLFLRTSSDLPCYGHRVYRFTSEVWKARVWLAATHYIESEITRLLRTSKYIVLN